MFQHCGNQQAAMGLACRFPGARGLWGGRRPSSPPCGTCRGVYCALSICVGTREAGVKGLMDFFPLWFPRIASPGRKAGSHACGQGREGATGAQGSASAGGVWGEFSLGHPPAVQGAGGGGRLTPSLGALTRGRVRPPFPRAGGPEYAWTNVCSSLRTARPGVNSRGET